MRPLRLTGLALGLSLCSLTARAQERADALFERGVDAFLSGKFDEGCPLLERSYALDPLPGVVFTLAECQFGWGKAKTAADNYAKFLDVVGRLPPAEASKHADRAAVAIRKRALATQRIASITVQIRGQWVPGTRVTLGGRDVTLLVGKPIEVDPGPVNVVVAPPGRPISKRALVLRASQHEQVELVIEQAATVDEPVEPPVAAPAPEAAQARPPTAAYAFGGVGLLGLAVGGVTGILAHGKKSSIEDNCPNRVCNAEGRSAVDSGQNLAAISTVSVGVGIASLGVATYLFLRSDRRPAASSPYAPRVSLGIASASVSGRF